MAKITVTAKIGNTYHPKYGMLVLGAELTIDEEDFGDEIFERTKEIAVAPPASLSPLPSEGEGRVRGGPDNEAETSNSAIRNPNSEIENAEAPSKPNKKWRRY